MSEFVRDETSDAPRDCCHNHESLSLSIAAIAVDLKHRGWAIEGYRARCPQCQEPISGVDAQEDG